jgi:hypothetical protein
MTQNHVIVVFTLIVFSGGEIPVESVNFPSFLCVWKHPWSRVSKCHLLFSFPFIAFHFAFISSHVPFMLHSLPFILLSCPFMFCRYVSKIQAFESWYAQPVRWVSAQTLAFFSYFVVVFVIVLLSLWRPVQVAIFRVHEPWTCTCISSLLCFFTLIVCWPANALVVRRGKPS